MCAQREASRTRRQWCSDLDLRVQRYDPHIRILRGSGSLTGDHAERFCMMVREQLALIPRLLVLELSRVAAVDGAGAQALVQAARLADEAGIRLALVTGISTAVDTMLRVDGLDELFEVHSRLGPAIAPMTEHT
jgi:anti-anti-sigma factor